MMPVMRDRHERHLSSSDFQALFEAAAQS